MNWLTVKHPARAGIVCILVVIGIVLAALAVPQLILKVKTNEFHAQFATAAGLSPDDPVNVAGVPSGVVTSLSVRGNSVDVAFRLDNGVTLGEDSRADIKISTLLGRRSLDITPEGSRSLPSGSSIAIENTSVPFTLDDLGRGAGTTADNLDLQQLRNMLTVVSDTSPDDPELIRRSLDSITTLSVVVTDNDDAVRSLLTGAQQTTATLVEQKETLETLLGNADLVMATIADRREVLNSLIRDLNQLTTTAAQFLGENQPLVDSVLADVHDVTAVLAENEQSLTTLLENFAPSVRYVTNATGNGNWLDLNSPSTLIPDNWLCVVGLVQGCR
ncbi:MCE family protein [Rhodococcus sp. OK302]|uniref:MCE family protein n=1 Tax=Rhodococcus sp. OK302 TaxID=1882769 RepID=UPI000B9F0F35|nr:MCE family protein [Rhodococcus sp. OK302]OYD67915.1 phospholipid/cholesterol/gamma-HCH transport system substrate-binding protein [Rhodococcus sp. OK302]